MPDGPREVGLLSLEGAHLMQLAANPQVVRGVRTVARVPVRQHACAELGDVLAVGVAGFVVVVLAFMPVRESVLRRRTSCCACSSGRRWASTISPALVLTPREGGTPRVVLYCFLTMSTCR